MVVVLAKAVLVTETVVVLVTEEIFRNDDQYDVTGSSFLTSATTSVTTLQMS
jgi:hypothetical protein